MKLTCPSCDAAIPAVDVDLASGWGKCSKCDDIFPLADVLPGYISASTDAVVEQPFDAWAQLDRSLDRLAIFLPARGMRVDTWRLLGFAAVWLAFIAFWTASALGVFFNPGKAPDMQSVIFACFSIPFWLVGIGLLGVVLWKSRRAYTVYFDAQKVLAQWNCSIVHRRRILEREQVQHARAATKSIRSDNDIAEERLLAEIVFERGSFGLPCETPSEQRWVVSEINKFLKDVPPQRVYAGTWPPADVEEYLNRLKQGALQVGGM